jgi:chromosome segregation protein
MAKVKRKKRSNKRVASKRSRLIDNPLLQSTLKPSQPAVKPTVLKEVKTMTLRGEKEEPKHLMSPEEEKVSVFEIISDLEKQLDTAFSIKEDQEKEIIRLKEQLTRSNEKAAASEAKLKELRGALVSQEELSSELEFLENERLEAGEKIKAQEEELKQKLDRIKESEAKMEMLSREIETRDTRIEQIELELTSTNKTAQSFQNQISLLEDKKEELSDKLEDAQAQISGVIADRDKYKIELERARESLDEIRLMLAETRAKAREHYYKRSHSRT